MLFEIFGRLPDVRDNSLAHFKMAGAQPISDSTLSKKMFGAKFAPEQIPDEPRYRSFQNGGAHAHSV